MQIQLEVPEYVIDKYIQTQADKGIVAERNEATATEAYTEYMIMSYMFPVNPDGTVETDQKIRKRIHALLTAASSCCLKLKHCYDERETARNLINMCKLAFGGNNGK